MFRWPCVLWVAFLALGAEGFIVASSTSEAPRVRRRSGPSNSSDGGVIAAAWYAGWHATDFPLSQVSWAKYSIMTYAFAVPTADPSVISLDPSDKTLLPKFVAAAHQHNVSASLSIGGWAGSRFFSTSVGSPNNRTAFVKAIVDLAKQYKLDGIDFDWEYPGRQGIGCNVVSANDTTNFLSFLQQLRQDPTGSNLVLSAATAVTPFLDASGHPSSDVSAFASVLDHISIMNYDIWSFWSSGVGPNAPLNDTCAGSSNRNGSAVSAVQAWTNAGIPSHQIVLGVPAYGHSFAVEPSNAFASGSTTELNSFPSFNASAQPVGDRWDGAPGVDLCGAQQGQGGVFTFWGLIEEGFLNPDGSVASGIASRFDECSQTPYVYNQSRQTMVSYDNAQSFTAKGNLVRALNLGGFAVWEAGGDSGDILLDAIRTAIASNSSSPFTSSSSPNSSSNSAISSGIMNRMQTSIIAMFLSLVLWSC
ncbi:hypothetical protein HGRIS_003001 [Hohenbuehelia grisea]|uniref:GH18 domain-containing protein n=1 Tax=Hohenbuehelia grisea TaxID=104357 RepID=A0ABR3JN55_9AGAR